MIVPTSKMTLKMSCLQACGNDVYKATELYDFLAKDMQALPDFDAPKPTVLQQARDTIGGLFSWVDANQDKLVGAYNMFQSIRGGGQLPMPTGAPVDAPPIPPIK